MHASAPTPSRAIREQVGKGRVICGLSGGVDSSVAAVLLHEAIATSSPASNVDTGLMRAGETEQVLALVSRPLQTSRCCMPYRQRHVPYGTGRRQRSREEAQRIIGAAFIDVFDYEAAEGGRRGFSLPKARSIPT